MYVAMLLLCIAAITLPGCQKEATGGTAQGGSAGGPPPAPVRVATAESRRVPVEVSTFGNAEPLSSVELKAQASGEIIAVLFKEGDEVEQGQELFKIDPRPFEADLAEAEANVARFEAQLAQAEANLRANEVRAGNAQVELDRNKTLLEREIVTQEEFDQSRTAAEAMRAAAGAESAGVRSAREEIRAAQAAIQTARLNLEYCTVRAPVSGRTGNLMAHQGDVVNASAGAPLVHITQMKPIYVSFTLPEQYLSKIRTRNASGAVTVMAAIPHADTPPVAGRLSFIDNAVDRATSTIRLKATYENEDEVLWPGQYVDVRVELDVLENATTVPARAVQTSQDGPFVYVVNGESKAELRRVQTGPQSGEVIVIESGLQAGERVVTDGHLRVTPDGTVKLLDSPAPAEPAAQ